MAQKKSNYWDQIFANQFPEADDASQNEENTPESTDAPETHELDQNVREILFEEEGPDAAPTAALQKEFELETPTKPASAENKETPADDSQDEDLFFGWTQTTKTYSSLNIGDEEKQKTEAEAASEAQDEAKENPSEIPAEEVAQVTAEDEAEAEEEAAEENAAEVAAEAEESEEKAEESKTETEAANEPILSEDGSLRITLNTYKHPTKGFGFGLLEEAEDSEESEDEETAEETAEEIAQAEVPEESPAAEEPDAPVAPEGLDSWGSLAFELGLPVTVPETAPKASAPKAPAKMKKDEKPARSGKEEKLSKSRRADESVQKTESKIVIDLDDEDFISPENVFAVTEKESRSRRGSGSERGRQEEREPVSDFGLKQVQVPEMDETVEPEVPRRRRRRGSASQESSSSEKKAEAIGAIVAGVVASKAKDEAEKSGRKSGRGRAERPEFQEDEAPVSRRERSRRSRKVQAEEVPQDDFVLTDEDFTNQAVREDEDEANAIPNGARSRRRRRAQHEKMEQTKTRAAAQVEEEDEENEAEEVSVQPKKRSRRDGRNRFREELEDEKNDWMDVEEDSEDEADEDEDEAPRGRRQRRSGRSGGRNQFQESRDSDEDFEDEEDHVFTEVGDDEEDEEDDEWETDFSQHDVPGWRYTIDFIVNSNLKARKREPSSMVENIARMNKRGGKRK